MDIFITDDPPTVVLASSEDPNIANGDPVEVVSITNNGATSTFNVMILRFAGPAPLAMKYVLFNRFVTINEHGTSSGTNYGHPNAAGAESVGAAEFSKTPFFGVSPPLLESFSSAGPTLIRFNTSGNAISPVTRNKPEIVAPDGTNTTFFGSDSTNDADSFPNFFGTSAAAPHAAAAAALMLDANGSLSPSDIYSALETTAIDMESEGFDFDSGFGLIQADDAVGAVASVAGICTPPDFGDWTVTQSCTLTGSPTASANVIVGAGITLTIDGNATLDIDFINFHLLIRDNASVIVQVGGKINRL